MMVHDDANSVHCDDGENDDDVAERKYDDVDLQDERNEKTENNYVDKKHRSQDRRPRFVRTCAIEMHAEFSQEPFFVGIYTKSASRQTSNNPFVRACAVEMHMGMSQEPFCVIIYKVTWRSRIENIVFRTPTQSKCTSVCHKNPFV
jgi:hypothetical protein